MEDNSTTGGNLVVGEWEGLFRSPSDAPQVPDGKGRSRLSPGEKAAAVYQARRVRGEVFGDAGYLFTDPAWDILLTLFVAQEESRRVSINQARAASGVPTTTALRWIGSLAGHALVSRRADPMDKRRCYLSLTARGDNLMREWLSRLP